MLAGSDLAVDERRTILALRIRPLKQDLSRLQVELPNQFVSNPACRKQTAQLCRYPRLTQYGLTPPNFQRKTRIQPSVLDEKRKNLTSVLGFVLFNAVRIIEPARTSTYTHMYPRRIYPSEILSRHVDVISDMTLHSRER